MIESITTILASASDLAALEGWLRKRVRTNRGPKRAMFLELQTNYRVLRELHVNNQQDISDIVSSLKTQTFEKLAGTDFNFNTLKRSKVSAKLTRGSKHLSSYANQSTEHLILSIYEKIELLKRYDALRAKKSRAVKNIRFGVRLSNITKLMVLLIRHIKGV